MTDKKPDKELVYMICPFCRDKAYQSWTDRALAEWTRHHIERQRCRA